MTKHSAIGASSMHRWAKCPGSVRLSKLAGPSKSSKYADEGTRAHELAAQVLTNKGLFPETRNLDAGMVEAVTVYTDAIAEDLKEEGSKIWVEQSFDLSALYPGLYGTADAIVYLPRLQLLKVYDYKHGAGIPVDVGDEDGANVQLLYYALGSMYSITQEHNHNSPVQEVELVIVQPRCMHPDGSIRRLRIPVTDLIDFSADLVDAAKRTLDPKAPLVAGDHCRFCPAAGSCPQIHSKATDLAKQEFSAVSDYDHDKLAGVLEWLPTFEAWISSVREFAYSEAEQGRMPPGWKLVAKRSTRKWRDKEDTSTKLMEEFGLLEEEVFIKNLKSPAQIETILKGEEKKQLAALIVAESSGYTLVPESDKRLAISKDAKSEFDVVE